MMENLRRVLRHFAIFFYSPASTALLIFICMLGIAIWWDLQNRFTRMSSEIIHNQKIIVAAEQQALANDRLLEELLTNEMESSVQHNELLKALQEFRRRQQPKK